MARWLTRSGELAAAVVLSLAVVVTAQGWLYLLRPKTTGLGPAVGGALPLDELARHSGASLGVFVTVWAAAGIVLGSLAAAARVDRLTAALVFALMTGAWLYTSSGLSIFVVRQIPAGEAFRSALYVPSTYVAAAAAGLGGAVLGVSRRWASRRAPALLAVFVAGSGILDVASAVTPEIASRLRLVENATPDVVPKLASALVIPAGLALVVLSRGLWRRRHRAWQIAVVVVFAAALLHMLKGLDYEEAAANTLIGLALVARRHDFAGRGDPSRRGRVLAHLALYTAAIFAYGFVALWVNRLSAERPFTAGFAFHETAESLIGMHVRGSEHLTGGVGLWFPLSVLLLGVIAAFALLREWLAPWRYRFTAEGRARERAERLVAQWGSDSLAPFSLRADKSYFFSEDEQAFLAYRVVAGVAVISGDPIGPPGSVAAVLARFIAYARERDWRVAALGASERYLDVYRKLGLNALYHGDEAVIDVASFSLDGRAVRKVRQSVSRLERRGYSVVVRYAGEVDDETRAELEDVFARWSGAGPTKGFTMELDALFRLDGREAVFVIGFDEDGDVAGFLHFAALGPAHVLSLSSMPRRSETPNGFNEWLVVETVLWAQEHGYERISMNFAPFAAVFSREEPTWKQRLQRRTLHAVKGRFQLDNLLNFNRKFMPHWEPRYVVYEGALDLPRVGVAGLTAEGYLSLPGVRR